MSMQFMVHSHEVNIYMITVLYAKSYLFIYFLSLHSFRAITRLTVIFGAIPPSPFFY
jgi:hypothetical protein